MASTVRRRVAPARRGRTRPAAWRTIGHTIGRTLAGTVAAAFAFVSYLYLTLPDVRPLASTPPTETSFMRLRDASMHAQGLPSPRAYEWVPYGRIAPALSRAVLVAEDDLFWQHDGFDLVQIRQALEDRWQRGQPLRGGSTITQQLAKNLYLSPSRSPVRKAREVMLTRQLERLLTKQRILELYLNVVEWGDGVWGAEAASRRYFGKSAAQLTAAESALLAGSLINPVRYSPGAPPRRLRSRQQMILRRMGTAAGAGPTRVARAEDDAAAATDEVDGLADEAAADEADESDEGLDEDAPRPTADEPAPVPVPEPGVP